MMKLIPKNWAKFQHYKDRCPPWIKLHRDILNDRVFMGLPTASKALAPLMWLLASESKNGIFDASIEELEFRLRISPPEIKIGIKSLIEKGFFIDANTMLAPCLQDAIPETEKETEKETERETKTETEKKGRATRLQDNWQPSDDMIQFCLQERPDLDWKFVSEGFRDYWISQAGAKGRKADWFATWRNWVRNQRKAFGNNQPASGKTQNQINADLVLAELRGLENAR
jgi:hypothetical protein